MAKGLFFISICGLVGLVTTSGVMVAHSAPTPASNTVAVTRNDDSELGTVYNVDTSYQRLDKIFYEKLEVAEVANNYARPIVRMRNYTVSIYSDTIVQKPNYTSIYKTGLLIYAHNSWNLLGSIAALSLNENFTITEGGVARTYEVKKIVEYDKNFEKGIIQYNRSGSYMRSVVKATDPSGVKYDVALMTCAGRPVGEDDAEQRLVVYADAV